MKRQTSGDSTRGELRFYGNSRIFNESSYECVNLSTPGYRWTAFYTHKKTYFYIFPDELSIDECWAQVPTLKLALELAVGGEG